MDLSSPKIIIDKRLLSVEDQFCQRQYPAALQELKALNQSEFDTSKHELGLYFLLIADGNFYEGNYRKAVEYGLSATRILAGFPMNRRYGRVQLVLSKAYYAVGDMKNAEIRARDALAAYRRASETHGQVDSLNQLAGIAYVRCDYSSSASFLEEALAMVTDNPRRVTQLTGNLGRTRIRTGQWAQAESDLVTSIKSNREGRHEISEAMNLLSIGYLQLRRQQYTQSQRSLDKALDVVSRLDLKRERVIYLEYSGELAYEKGDIFRAKAILNEAYNKAMMLAPGSALVSQSSRRLAEVELALDNFEEAMKYGQKALELSTMIDEKLEIGLSRRAIARVFLAKSDFESALEHINRAIELLREVNDPYELARTLLVQAEICMAVGSDETEKIRLMLKGAYRLFKKLKLSFWMYESDFKTGVFICQRGDLAGGFRKLSRAEKGFSSLEANVKVRAVSKFLRSLSEQAVALSISEENEFKIFGNLITPAEYSNLKSSEMDTILQVLLKKTGGDRALIYAPDSDGEPLISSFPFDFRQTERFTENFGNLLGEEINLDKPTLILDCRRDPFINGLFSGLSDIVSTVIVLPFKTSETSTGYLYLDRLSGNNGLNPFNQTGLNFAVGFSDLIAFKWTELQKNQLAEDNRRLKSQLMQQAAFPNILTRNPEMLRLLSQVRQVVDSNISITIEGETGCGKDLLASAIHYNSSRRDKRFVSVNCAALPESLLESELFGFKRGAFTGADRDKSGLFEEADGGTFFLDEIADMPLSIQAKVLRIMEEKEIVRLGETVARKVDVRIVSATNGDLRELMSSGKFRQDLFYRLSAMTFRLPPLRDRKEDIPLLVNHFLDGSGKSIGPNIMKLLVAYDWPGNVRELDNEVKKLVLLAGDDDEIKHEIISDRLLAAAGCDSDLDRNYEDGCSSPAFDKITFTERYGLYDYIATHEKGFIVWALKQKHGVKKHAAALLNIPESTLRLKIKQYGIDVTRLDHDE
ncbi:MAG: sigma 54-interacting transcriptional regulator [candidate division Zixibacteria bacterium]|nr:sigma 54-interacting transcriptional regulator [candidate division Zixibacteria bacterium]